MVLEALSMEIPVLVRDIGVYQGWLEDGIHVWKARDLEGFSSCIQGILDHTYPDLTKKAREIAEQRDLRNIGECLARIYRKVI